MVEIVWTVRSYEHLHEIGEYIAKDSPFQAKRVIQSIIKAIKRIESNIRIGHIIPEIQNDSYRELRVFSYRILYKIITENKIAIIGIVHSKRLLDTDTFQ